MKRLHIHIGVERLDEAIQFYNQLLGTKPVKQKPDYAKWLVDDPRINLAISTRASTNGVDHLGIQVDEDHELTNIRKQLNAGNIPATEEGETLCCYAKSDKTWIMDPSGVAWEAYRTMEDADIFSTRAPESDSSCCGPGFGTSPDSEAATKETSGCCG